MIFKSIISIIMVLSFLGCNHSQNNEISKIKPSQVHINIGRVEISKNTTLNIKIGIRNCGNCPLVISNILTSCGCMVAYWDKKPILMNKKSCILVKLKMQRKGYFSKRIGVKANIRKNEIILSITGEII